MPAADKYAVYLAQFKNLYSRYSPRPDFTSKLEHGTPKCYIALYNKLNQALVNLNYKCDVKSGLRVSDTVVILSRSRVIVSQPKTELYELR